MSGRKTRKVYKKVYRLKGEKINGEPIKQLSAEHKKIRKFLLEYGRICNALKMEGHPKPELEKIGDDNYEYIIKLKNGYFKRMNIKSTFKGGVKDD